MNRDDLHPLLEAYRDGTIDEAAAEQLAAVIRAGGEDAQWVFEQLEFSGELYQAHEDRGAETFARSFMERLKAEDSDDGFTAAFVDARKKSARIAAVRAPSTSFRAMALLAAGVAIVAGVFLAVWTRDAIVPIATQSSRDVQQESTPVSVAQVASTSGRITLDGVVTNVNTAVHPGATLRTEGGAECTIVYPDGTRVVVQQNSELTFEKPGTTNAKQICLAAGSFRADVTKQPRNARMVLRTKFAEATVLGTQLQFTALERATRLQVDEGSVRFKRLKDNAQIDVETGNFALADESTGLLYAMAFSQIPADWTNTDVGSVGLPGVANFANGKFVISGSGKDIWGFEDSFHYVHRTFEGDGEIIARVTFLSESDKNWTKFGVMMRETLDAGATHAMTIVSADPRGKARMQRREKTGGDSISKGLNGWDELTPTWVKLVRRGNEFSGYLSKDGSNWQALDTGTIPMAAKIHIGLIVLSHDNTRLAQGQFEHVRITAGDGKVLYDADRKSR
jgi:hypothetical protein